MAGSEASSFDALASYLGSYVLVKLKNGVGVKGILRSYDHHLNLVLSEAEELSNGSSRRLGLVLIRGDSVIVISPAA